jgi:hypothetical protein
MRTHSVSALLALLAAGCLPNRADLQMTQTVVEMGDAINDVRQVMSDLQDQIDSLRFVMARQDTVIRQLANLAGVQIPR